MRPFTRYACASVVTLTLAAGFTPQDVEAQRCFPCFRKPNPKDRNPDRREDRPNTLETPDGRDSYTRPTELPGSGSDSRDFVPKPETIQSAPGDVAPDEVLPPPPASNS